MNKSVIIVGAGVGGLATAVKLLSRGYKVTIYEKNNRIGGRVNLIETDIFRFDLTASILMTPEIYKDVFRYVGKNYRDYINFIDLDPIYRAFYSDGTHFDLFRDIGKLTESLETLSKNDSIGYYKFLSKVYEKYLIANKYFLNNSFTRPLDFFNFVSLQKMLQINTFSNAYSHISSYIDSDNLRNLIAFQSLYVGISPFDGPNIYNLVPTISQLYGLSHLKGGMYSYIEALEKMIYEFGGKIIIDNPVEEIVIENVSATGIKSKSGIDKADIVVCNADFPYAIKELIIDNEAKGKYTDKKISKMKYSCSTFIMHLGLKKKYPKLSVHNIYIGDDFKENIQSAFFENIPENPSLYIYCPSKIDDTMAQEDTECMNITVRVPNLLFNDITWNNETINIMKDRVFAQLSNIEGLSDIKENIIYESVTTPNDMLTEFNSYGGTSFGLSPTLLQTNYFRPHIKSPTVDDLYFVGNSVHPGTGISIVLLSSKLVVEEILKK